MDTRSAHAGDIDQLVDLWSREGGPTTLAGGVPEALALLRRDPEALIVAQVDDMLVGCVVVGWDGWRCHLYRLVVEPEWRRAGVAKRLVAEATARARRLGARKIDAMVNFDNESAITFWERHEFVHDPGDGRWSLRL